jgi:hypothetical protein
MAFEKRQSSDQGMNKPRGQEPKPMTLKEAHGQGIQAESTYDLMDHVSDPQKNEGMLGSQGEPQPSGGAPGMRPQLGSFESGQTDTGGGAPGEDVEPGERPFIGVDSDLPEKIRKAKSEQNKK